jgi:hypothetical protein
LKADRVDLTVLPVHSIRKPIIKDWFIVWHFAMKPSPVFYACIKSGTVQEITPAANIRVSVCQFAGAEEWEMGRRIDGGKDDEGVPVAEASTRGAI